MTKNIPHDNALPLIALKTYILNYHIINLKYKTILIRYVVRRSSGIIKEQFIKSCLIQVKSVQFRFSSVVTLNQ